MPRIASNICPVCDNRFAAHKGNTKTFRQLTPRERDRSIRMMTINLKRAINADLPSKYNRRILWVVEYMARRGNR